MDYVDEYDISEGVELAPLLSDQDDLVAAEVTRELLGDEELPIVKRTEGEEEDMGPRNILRRVRLKEPEGEGRELVRREETAGGFAVVCSGRRLRCFCNLFSACLTCYWLFRTCA